jgi:glycosyltransferase involved in cell wall biosynthesis
MNNAVVIPAYNAERTLADVVGRIIGDVSGIWIVDDGSPDGTARVALDLAQTDPRIRVVRREKNGGYGAAMKAGLRAAMQAGGPSDCEDGCPSNFEDGWPSDFEDGWETPEAPETPDVVACVHADGQYAPEELPAMLDTLGQRNLDLLQGSRVAAGTALSGGMPAYKYAAGRVLTFLENRVFGLRMTDYHSGYLLYGRRALRSIRFADLSDSFDFDLEVIASARALGLRIGERPIPTHYGDESSSLSPIPYGFRVLGVMLKYLRGHYRGANKCVSTRK